MQKKSFFVFFSNLRRFQRDSPEKKMVSQFHQYFEEKGLWSMK